MEKIDKAIEILQAFKEGKTIEMLVKPNLYPVRWDKICEDGKNCKGYNILSLMNQELRIISEPTYRPYANAEEFLKASKEHGHYVKLDTGSYHFVDEFRKDSIHIRGYGFSTFTDLKQVFVWADTLEPCGILEQ